MTPVQTFDQKPRIRSNVFFYVEETWSALVNKKNTLDRNPQIRSKVYSFKSVGETCSAPVDKEKWKIRSDPVVLDRI